jgi:hypothetical protein
MAGLGTLGGNADECGRSRHGQGQARAVGFVMLALRCRTSGVRNKPQCTRSDSPLSPPAENSPWGARGASRSRSRRRGHEAEHGLAGVPLHDLAFIVLQDSEFPKTAGKKSPEHGAANDQDDQWRL